jgi:hypothetical protein
MLNIVCFYWQGQPKSGWEHVDLGCKYVNNLYVGIRNNLTLPFRFFCFHQHNLKMDKVNKEIEKIPFDSPSWFRRIPKMKAFDYDLELEGRVIIFDLDLVITGNINDICSYTGPFMTRESFLRKGESGGDIVSFEAKKYPFWEYVQQDHQLIRESKGNERVIYRKYFKDSNEIDYIQELYPNQVFSYKRHVGVRGQLPDNCRILSCHGKPRLHRIENKNVRKFFKC